MIKGGTKKEAPGINGGDDFQMGVSVVTCERTDYK